MLFFRQLWALVYKNLLIALVRHPFTTPLRAFVLPVVFGWFLSYARNFFVAPSVFGIGSPTPVRSLQDAYSSIDSRDKLVFVDSGFRGGDIERVITQVGDQVQGAGKTVEVISNESDVVLSCRSSLRGTSNCLAGVVFHSSPTEGPEGSVWNYTMRADVALGRTLVVNRQDNDHELYVLPLQHAIDYAIAGLNDTVDSSALPEVDEYPYSSITAEERATNIRVRYMGSLIDVLGVAFFIGICLILYQAVGMQATERELNMAQLLECMMPNARRWQPQVIRLMSYHFAFTLIYLPGWIVFSIILQRGVFAQTSIGVVLVLHLLTGLSLASFGLFAASFFRKAQLSGITAIIISLLLAVLAQVYSKTQNSTVLICSLIFPSMNYTYFIVFMARWQAQNTRTDLLHSAPDNPWEMKGYLFFIFLAIQIFVYPVLAVIVERQLYGTSGGRNLISRDAGVALQLQNFSKHFYPTWLNSHVIPLFGKKRKEPVLAADDLSITLLPGQMTMLLGANGSGKSTTLDAIAGLSRPTSGTVSVDFSQGLGFCPQKNVHWPLLTVKEHIYLFDQLKSLGKTGTNDERAALVQDCDLIKKLNAQAKTLSGGQMRKLQLCMMFVGGSGLCLIDECSSGVDPIARQKILNILMAERSRSNRTLLFTSHYLDECDIADKIIIMSKGKVRIDGTAPEIKQSGVYRVHLYHIGGSGKTPFFDGVERGEMYDQTVYTVSSAKDATKLLQKIEEQGWKDYRISGPSIEDAFMKVAEEMVPSTETGLAKQLPSLEGGDSEEKSLEGSPEKELQLQSGSQIGPLRQGFVLFLKRALVFRRNVFPNLIAFFLMPIGAGLVSLFLKGFTVAGCTPGEQDTDFNTSSISDQLRDNLDVVVGPVTKLGSVQLILSTLFPENITNGTGNGGSGNSGGGLGILSEFGDNFHLVNSVDEFNNYIRQNFHNVTPGGAFLGDRTTLAYKGNGGIISSFFIQNVANMLASEVPIAAQVQFFSIPLAPDQGQTLQFIIYFGLVLSVYPAFFSLYPTLERLRNVRNLHYSNGVSALPLWLSYIAFDFVFILLGTGIATIIFTSVSGVFFSLGHLFVVFVFYGLTVTLLAYVVSLFARSQLAAFAISAAYQGVTFLLYMIAYLVTLTYAPVNKIDGYLQIVHYTLAIVFPSGSLIRALFVSLNEFSINCKGPDVYVSSPADISAYGAPILYLIIQSLVLFACLVWWDSGMKWSLFRRRTFRETDGEEKEQFEQEVIDEAARVQSATDDGLRVINVTKAFGKNVAVDNVSFGVKRGEVFGLLGPNGAGKSTTIGVIRGDLKPSNNSGDVFIENISLRKKRASARQNLGNCPQFDAMDQLTVREHISFYSGVRGVQQVAANTEEVIRAVGLLNFQDRMANSLSGGNKRKLSLAIALISNPGVILLDEPSSGLDVAAKRIMWRTLETVAPGRSIVLTTHSMEEADRLCQRAGIMAKRMLAVGTSDYLRKKHGDRYYVHVLLNSAPHTSAEEAERVRQWVLCTFDGAEADARSFHGQIRFSVPIRAQEKGGAAAAAQGEDSIWPFPPPDAVGRSGIATLFSTLEGSKKEVGFEYYSVSQTTLDQVFLSIVGKHNVMEENYGANTKEKKRWWQW